MSADNTNNSAERSSSARSDSGNPRPDNLGYVGGPYADNGGNAGGQSSESAPDSTAPHGGTQNSASRSSSGGAESDGSTGSAGSAGSGGSPNAEGSSSGSSSGGAESDGSTGSAGSAGSGGSPNAEGSSGGSGGIADLDGGITPVSELLDTLGDGQNGVVLDPVGGVIATGSGNDGLADATSVLNGAVLPAPNGIIASGVGNGVLDALNNVVGSVTGQVNALADDILGDGVGDLVENTGSILNEEGQLGGIQNVLGNSEEGANPVLTVNLPDDVLGSRGENQLVVDLTSPESGSIIALDAGGDDGAANSSNLINAEVGQQGDNGGLIVDALAGESAPSNAFLDVNALNGQVNGQQLLNAEVLTQGDQFQFPSLSGAGADSLNGVLSLGTGGAPVSQIVNIQPMLEVGGELIDLDVDNNAGIENNAPVVNAINQGNLIGLA